MMNDFSEACYYLPAQLVHSQRGLWHLYFNPDALAWMQTNEAGNMVIEALRTLKKASASQLAESISLKTGLGFDDIFNEIAQFLTMAAEGGLIDIEGCSHLARTNHFSLEEPSAPESLYLHLTSGCNLKCTYCYNVVDRKRWGLGGKLPFRVALNVLQQAKEMGIKNIFITGGEPLLHPKSISIAEFAHQFQLRVIFMTNGLLVSDEIAQRLAACCDQITISLDSYTPELHDINRGQGTHRRVLEAVKRLKAAGAKRVVIAGVITRYTQRERYSDFARYCKKLGVDEIFRKVYILQGDQRDELLKIDFKECLPLWEDELEKAISSNDIQKENIEVTWRDRCGMAYGVIAIGADGNVYPCQALISQEFASGNVMETPLREIWSSSEILKQLRGITVNDIAGCCDCVFKNICGGGCRALAYNVYRSPTAPIPKEFCAFLKLSAEREIWAISSQSASGRKP